MSPSSKPMRTLSNSTGAYAESAAANELMTWNPGCTALRKAAQAVRYTSGAGASLCKHHCAQASLCKGCALKKLASQIQGQLGEKHVGANDHDVRYHHRLRGGAPNALRSAAHRQPFVTTHGREDEPINDGLHHALHDIGKFQGIDGAGPELHGSQSQGKHRRHAAAEQP